MQRPNTKEIPLYHTINAVYENDDGYMMDMGEDEDKIEKLRQQEEKEAVSNLNTPMRWALDFANVFKSFIGSNYLGTPYAFKQSGLLGGIIGILLIAWITEHCCRLILVVKNELLVRKPGIKLETYGDVGHSLWGKPGSIVINIFLVGTQGGFCIGYTIFMATNIQGLIVTIPYFQEYSGRLIYGISIIFIFFTLVGLLFVKDVTHLGFTSIIANVTLIIGLLLLFSYDDFKAYDKWSWVNISTLPIFFGLITSSYEGIGLVIPVENTMTKIKWRYPLLLDITLVIVTIILGSFGICGYLTFGNATQAIITTNLPILDVRAIVVRICLVIAIFFTWPMQIYPVNEIMDKAILRRVPTRYIDIRANIIRVVSAFIVCLIAFLLPFFGYISSLIGALGSSALAFIFPAMFHFMVFRKSTSVVFLAKDVAIIIFGLVTMVIGTYTSVQSILEALGILPSFLPTI